VLKCGGWGQLAVDKAEEKLDALAQTTRVETATRHSWSLSENKIVKVSANTRARSARGAIAAAPALPPNRRFAFVNRELCLIIFSIASYV